jgi:hypothetical protein
VCDREAQVKLTVVILHTKEKKSMKNTFVKVVILGALFLSTTAPLPKTQVQFDGGGPYPSCIPGVNCAL